MRMRSKVFRLLFLPLAVIGFIFLSGCVEQPISQPSFSAADFAECLSENGVKVYGAWWCGHCDAQKELFGDAWSSVNYIECGVPGNTEEQSQICFDAGIMAYPTWEFKDGGRVQGGQGFQALSSLSDCPIPSGPAVISESKIFFEGPQQALQGAVDKEFSYSFCRPESAVSGATCGALAGATSDPINGKPPYSFTQGFSAGLLPPGLALNLNGVLEGTPTIEGAYNFEVCATDSLGSEDCRFIAFNASKEENSIAEKKAEGSESMTYQIDMDITFKHVGRDKQYTERAVLSAQKTISSSGRGKFIDISGERVPIKVFVDGYLDSGCMKGGREYKVRGTYSESYEGNVEVFMAYFSEEYSDYSPPELWVSLSSIEGLPRPESKTWGCVPTEKEISDYALDYELLNLGNFTDSIGFRLGYLTTGETEDEAFYSSAEGGTIDVSGPDIVEGTGQVLNDYTWEGSFTVKRIS